MTEHKIIFISIRPHHAHFCLNLICIKLAINGWSLKVKIIKKKRERLLDSVLGAVQNINENGATVPSLSELSGALMRLCAFVSVHNREE